jgi:hypothetical protein
MNVRLLATAAALALVAGAAQAQTVGHVGLNYTNTEVEAGGLEAEGDAFQVEGAFAFDLGGLGAQLDAAVTDSDDADAVFSGTAHLNTELGGARVGGFVGAIAADDFDLWGLGAEAQTNLGAQTVLYGQLGYGQSDDLGDADLWAVRGELRHYFTENFKLAGSLGFVNLDSDFGGEAEGWNAGVEGEYQFANTPFSVYGGYIRSEVDDADLESDTFQVGVRYTFGGSLQARDQAGAQLGGVSKLFGLAGLGF